MWHFVYPVIGTPCSEASQCATWTSTWRRSSVSISWSSSSPTADKIVIWVLILHLPRGSTDRIIIFGQRAGPPGPSKLHWATFFWGIRGNILPKRVCRPEDCIFPRYPGGKSLESLYYTPLLLDSQTGGHNTKFSKQECILKYKQDRPAQSIFFKLYGDKVITHVKCGHSCHIWSHMIKLSYVSRRYPWCNLK